MFCVSACVCRVVPTMTDASVITGAARFCYVWLFLAVAVAMCAERVLYAVVYGMVSLVSGEPTSGIYMYAVVSLIQRAAQSGFSCGLAALSSASALVASYWRALLWAFAVACVCVVGYVLLVNMRALLVDGAYVYNTYVGTALRRAIVDPVCQLADRFLGPAVALYNTFVHVPGAIVNRVLLPYVGNSFSLVAELIGVFVRAVVLLVTAVVRYFDMHVKCADYRATVQAGGAVGALPGISPSVLPDGVLTTVPAVACFEDIARFRALDLQGAVIELRDAHAPLIELMNSVCGVGGLVGSVFLSPLLDNQVAYAVHNLANAALVALVQVPIVTYDRCMLHRGPKKPVMVCIPDFEPAFDLLYAGLLNAGRVVDNFLDAALVAIEALVAGSAAAAAPCATLAQQMDSYAGVSRALFGGNLTVHVTQGSALYAETDGTSVHFVSVARDLESHVCDGCWPFTVDVRLGVAAIQYDKRAIAGDHGDLAGSLFGCTCVDAAAPEGGTEMRIVCTAVTYNNQATDPTRVIPVLFALASTRKYLKCKTTRISVQSVRWPHTRYTRPDDPSRSVSEGLPRGCEGSDCVGVDAALWVMPMCGDEDPVACLYSFSQASCFPYCLGLHVRGSRNSAILLHSATDWMEHVQLVDRSCVSGEMGLRIVQDNTTASWTGDVETGASTIQGVGEVPSDSRGSQPYTFAYTQDGQRVSLAAIAGSFSVVEECVYDASVVSRVERQYVRKYEAVSVVRLDRQPFAFAGDIALTAATSDSGDHFVYVDRLYGSEFGEYTLLTSAVLPAFSEMETRYEGVEPVNTIGSKLWIPYAWAQMPQNGVAAAATEDAVFYAENPHMDIYAAFFRYCRNTTQVNSVQFVASDVYFAIRIWRLRGIHCGGAQRCVLQPEKGSYVQLNVSDVFSGELTPDMCSVPFTVKVTQMEYFDPFNILVRTLRTTPSNLDAHTLEPLDAARAERHTLFLDPTTMRVGTDFFRDPDLSARTVNQAEVSGICPALRRTPNFGSMWASTTAILTESLRLGLRVLVVAPSFADRVTYEFMQRGSEKAVGGHTLMGLGGGPALFMNDRIYTSINRASNLFWRSIALVSRYVQVATAEDGSAPRRTAVSTLMNAAAIYGDATTTPVRSSVVNAMKTVPFGYVLGAPLSLGTRVNGLTQGSYMAFAIGMHPIAVFEYLHGIFAGIVADLVFQRFGGTWMTIRQQAAVYDRLVVSRQLSACGGISLAFGLGSAAGRFAYHQCVSAVHSQTAVMRGMTILFVDLPSIECMCVRARGSAPRAYINDHCLLYAPPDLRMYMSAYILNGESAAPALRAMCDTVLDGLEHKVRSLFDDAYAAQYESTLALSSAFSEFFGGDVCDDYAADQHALVLVPEPVSYFEVCMYTASCRLKCNLTLSEFELARSGVARPWSTVGMRRVVPSRFFYTETDLDPRMVPGFRVVAMFEPPFCHTECHTRTKRARCVRVAGWVSPTALSVRAFCMPYETGVALYASDDSLTWTFEVSLETVFGDRATYTSSAVGDVIESLPSGYAARYAQSALVDVKIVSYRRQDIAVLLVYSCDILLVSRSNGKYHFTRVFSCEDAPGSAYFRRVVFMHGVAARRSDVALVQVVQRGRDAATRTWHVPFSGSPPRESPGSILFAEAAGFDVVCVGESAYSLCARLLFFPKTASGTIKIYPVGVTADGFVDIVAGVERLDFEYSAVSGFDGYVLPLNFFHVPPVADADPNTPQSTYLDVHTFEILVSRDPLRVRFWLETLYVNTQTRSVTSDPSQKAVVNVKITRQCAVESCSGCTSLAVQRLCYQARQCALRKCIASPVHVTRTFCGFGLLAAARLEELIASGHGMWLMISETVGQVIVMPMRTHSAGMDLSVSWPEEAYYGMLCESKDVTAALASIFVSVIYSVGALSIGADVPVAGLMRVADEVNSEADVTLSLALASVANLLYQTGLYPLYMSMAMKNILFCDRRSMMVVIDAVTGMSIDISMTGDRRGTSGSVCLPPGEASALVDGSVTSVSAQRAVVGVLHAMGSAVIEHMIGKTLHPIDAQLVYAEGVLSGLQDVMQSLDRLQCTAPDFLMRDVSRCACGDDAATIPSARADNDKSAYWCRGTLYMRDNRGESRFIVNPYSFHTLRTMMRETLDGYLRCISTTNDGTRCSRPALPELDRQGVSTIAVFTRCRTNYNMKQWDEGAFAFYDLPLDRRMGITHLLDDHEFEEKTVMPCLRTQAYRARGNDVCLWGRLGAVKITEFFEYELIDASAGLNSANVDACHVFSGVAGTPAGSAIFKRCLGIDSMFDEKLYDDTGAEIQDVPCEVPSILWSGNSRNKVDVASLHTFRAGNLELRFSTAEAEQAAVRADAADFFRTFFDGEDGDTSSAVEDLDFSLFSAEGDSLHQMFDCLFLGPYARMDMWTTGSSGSLPSPVYYRDAQGGLDRAFDLPCAGGTSAAFAGLGTDKLQGDYKVPFTCGSDARRSIIKYFVRDIVSGEDGDSDIAKSAIYESLRELRAVWTQTAYGCTCPNGTPQSPRCCADGDAADTARFMPPNLRGVEFMKVKSATLTEKLMDAIESFAVREIFAGKRHREVFSRHSKTPESERYNWWPQRAAVEDDALFRASVPLRSYAGTDPRGEGAANSEFGQPFVGGDTLWHMCTGLVSQVIFTMPLDSATSRPAAAERDVFAAMRDAGAFVSGRETYIESVVDGILHEAYGQSPLFWHYAARHVPSDSVVCEDYAAFPSAADEDARLMRVTEAAMIGKRPYTEVITANGTDTLRVADVTARALGTARRGCFCDWFHPTTPGVCRVPEEVCVGLRVQFMDKLSNTRGLADADELRVLDTICDGAPPGEYPTGAAIDRVLRAVLSGSGSFARWDSAWRCPALHVVSSDWGVFVGPLDREWVNDASAETLAAQRHFDAFNLTTHGRAGLRIGSIAAYLDGDTNIREVVNPAMNANYAAHAAQRLCERSVRLLLSEAGAAMSLAKRMVLEQFPVAQGISESAPVAHCLRFVVEYARLVVLRYIDRHVGGVDVELALAAQSREVATWRKRCALQAELVSKCNTFGVFDMVPAAGDGITVDLTCPFRFVDEHPGRAYVTPGCVVYVEGVFYDPCMCGLCSTGGGDVEVRTSALVARAAQCRVPFDVRTLSSGHLSGVWPDPDRGARSLDDRGRRLVQDIRAWRGSVERPVHLAADFADTVLRDGGADVAGSAGNTAKGGRGWGVAEGVLSDASNEDTLFCDLIVDWWPETWDMPVGYHVTVPCSADETGYRVFDESYVLYRSGDGTHSVYQSGTTLRNKTLVQNFVGAAGECTKNNVGMPFVLSNTIRLCTREAADQPIVPEDPSMPFRPLDVHEYGEGACSDEPFSTPWDVDTSKTHVASIGLIMGWEGYASDSSYPSSSSRLIDVGPRLAVPSVIDGAFDPWYGCAHAPIFRCTVAADCVARLLPRVSNDVRGRVQCRNGVCALSEQDGFVFECSMHSECAARGRMCAGNGRCSKSYVHVINSANTTVDVQLFSDACARPGEADGRDMFGGSPWENVPDILHRHGLCAFRNWEEYHSNVVDSCRRVGDAYVCNSTDRNWEYSRDNKNLRDTVNAPGTMNLLQGGVMAVRAHSCDRDYMYARAGVCTPATDVIYASADGPYTGAAVLEYTRVFFTHRHRPGAGAEVRFAPMLNAGSLRGSRSAALTLPGGHRLLMCRTILQCAMQSTFTVDGVRQQRMVAGRAMNVSEVFGCTPFMYRDGATCVIDRAVLPLYGVMCATSESASFANACPLRDNAVLASACQLLGRWDSNQREAIISAANRLATAVLRPWSGSRTFDAYLDTMKCAKFVWARMSAVGSRGIYHFSSHGAYEYPFAWWVMCTLLGGIRASDTNDVVCDAWNTRFAADDGEVRGWMSVGDWLSTVMGGYDVSYITAAASIASKLAKGVWKNATDDLSAMLSGHTNIMCYVGKKYIWHKLQTNPLYRDTVLKMRDGSFRGVGNFGPADKCTKEVGGCVVDGDLYEYPHLGNFFDIVVDDLRPSASYTVDTGGPMYSAHPMLYKFSESFIENYDTPREGECQSFPNQDNNRYFVDDSYKYDGTRDAHELYRCVYESNGCSDPAAPRQSAIDHELIITTGDELAWYTHYVVKSSLGRHAAINVCSGRTVDQQGRACNLIMESRADSCVHPWRDWFGGESCPHTLDAGMRRRNPAGAVCLQSASTCFAEGGGPYDGGYIVVPAGVEVRRYSYVGATRVRDPRALHPQAGRWASTTDVPMWTMCPLPGGSQCLHPKRCFSEKIRALAGWHADIYNKVLLVPGYRYYFLWDTWRDYVEPSLFINAKRSDAFFTFKGKFDEFVNQCGSDTTVYQLIEHISRDSRHLSKDYRVCMRQHLNQLHAGITPRSSRNRALVVCHDGGSEYLTMLRYTIDPSFFGDPLCDDYHRYMNTHSGPWGPYDRSRVIKFEAIYRKDPEIQFELADDPSLPDSVRSHGPLPYDSVTLPIYGTNYNALRFRTNVWVPHPQQVFPLTQDPKYPVVEIDSHVNDGSVSDILVVPYSGGFSSMSIQLLPGYTCGTDCSEPGKLSCMAYGGLSKCFPCKAIPTYHCVGDYGCGYRFPIDLTTLGNATGEGGGGGTLSWLVGQSIPDHVYAILRTISPGSATSVQRGRKVLLWLLEARVRHLLRLSSTADVRRYGVAPERYAYYDTEFARNFAGYEGGSVLKAYENGLSGDCTSGAPGSTEISYDTCNLNGQLKLLRGFVEQHMQRPRFPRLKRLEQLFWEVSRDVLLAGVIPAWASSARTAHVSQLLDENTQCSVNAAFSADSVCYKRTEAGGEEVRAVNPWTGGGIDIETMRDTLRGLSAFEEAFPEPVDPAAEKLQYYDVSCNAQYGRLHSDFKNSVSTEQVYDRRIAEASVPESVPNNVCAKRMIDDGVCRHRQGMLGGTQGERVGDVYTRQARIPRADEEAFTGLYNKANFHVQGQRAPLPTTYGLLRVREDEIGGHNVGLVIGRGGEDSMHVYALPLAPVSSTAEARDKAGGGTSGAADQLHWLRSVTGTDRDTQYDTQRYRNLSFDAINAETERLELAKDGARVKAIEMLNRSLYYPRTARAGGQPWLCPLLRRMFYSASVPAFGPLAPNPMRAEVMFAALAGTDGLHPTMRAHPGRIAPLMRYKTMNGFCICRSDDLTACMTTVTSPDPCGLQDTVRSLFDGAWRNATVRGGRLPCEAQLDWPFVDRGSRMRDGHLHDPRDATATGGGCAALDRLRAFQYRYVNVPNAVRTDPTGRTTLSSGGDCHTGRATYASNLDEVRMLQRTQDECQLIGKTAATRVVKCGDTPTPMPVKSSRTLDDMLRIRSNTRQRCNTCSKPPTFRRDDGSPRARNASSFGVPVRWSAARMLAQSLRRVVCEDAADEQCNGLLNEAAWSDAQRFMDAFFDDAERLFSPSSTANATEPPPVERVSARRSLRVEDEPDDGYLWTGRPWVLCQGGADGECVGNISKAEWTNPKTRAQRCGAIISQAAERSGTTENLNLCDLSNRFNELCVKVAGFRRRVFEANCLAGGACADSSFFYQPSAYADNNKQFVRSTVREFYERQAPGSCVETYDIEELATAAAEATAQCAARWIDPVRIAVSNLRKIARVWARIVYRAYMLALSVVQVLLGPDSDYSEQIKTNFLAFVDEAGNLVGVIAGLAYDMIFTRTPAGQALRDAVTWVCNAMNWAHRHIIKPVACIFVPIVVDILELLANALDSFTFLVRAAEKPRDELREIARRLPESMVCNETLDNAFECSKIFVDGAKTTISPPLPVASQCWLSATQTFGYNHAPVCTASSTCRADPLDPTLVVCAQCDSVVPDGFTTYGCDPLTKRCSCLVQHVERTRCASNAECLLPKTRCIFTDKTLGSDFGDMPCAECGTPLCAIDSRTGDGHCACPLEYVVAATCPAAEDTGVLPPGNGVCLVFANVNGMLSSAASYNMRSLAYTSCANAAPHASYCRTVFDDVGGSRVYIVSMTTAASSRRLLMFAETDAPEERYDFEWNATSEPCRSLVARSRAGGDVSVSDAYGARSCVFRRAVARSVIDEYGLNESVYRDTMFLSLTEFATDAAASGSATSYVYGLFVKHPSAALYVARQHPAIWPYAQSLRNGAVRAAWMFARTVHELAHARDAERFAYAASDNATLTEATRVAAQAARDALEAHYATIAGTDILTQLDVVRGAQALIASLPAPPVRPTASAASGDSEGDDGAERVVARRRMLSTIDDFAQKNQAMFLALADYTLGATSKLCGVIYDILIVVRDSFSTMKVLMTRGVDTRRGVRYVPEAQRAGGRLHDLDHNLREMQHAMRCFSATTKTTLDATDPSASGDAVAAYVRNMSAWSVFSDIAAATQRFVDFRASDDPVDVDCSLSENVRSLVFCNFDDVMTCRLHTRDVVIWGAALYVFLSIVAAVLGILIPPLQGTLGTVLWVSFLPLLLWLTMGYSVTCMPMIPHCVFDDLLYHFSALIPAHTNIARIFEARPGCLDAAPTDASCVLTCDDPRLGFQTWEDTVLWGLCSLEPFLRCSTVADAVHALPGKIDFDDNIHKIATGWSRRMDGVLSRKAVLATAGASASPPSTAYTLCFFMTLVRVVPVVAIAAIALGALLVLASTMGTALAQALVDILLQVFILVHTPEG